MARIEKTVFISYRRKDISWALAVYQYVASQKYDVFFDYTHIPSGDFEQIIVCNIKARAHFVLILTPNALDRTNNEGDWLRREIETAIDEKRNIIPLFFDGFSFGSPNVKEKLTGKMGNISRYNGLDVPSGYFPEAMERLSTRYLNTPLDAVIHPVSIEVRKRSKEEKSAANRALKTRGDIQELIKPALKKTEKPKQAPTSIAPEPQGTPALRKEIPWKSLAGIVSAIMVVVLCSWGGSSLWSNLSSNTVDPTRMSQPAEAEENWLLPITDSIGMFRFQDGSAQADQITFSSRNLTLPPEGSQYEAWLIQDDNQHQISIGIIQFDSDNVSSLTYVDESGQNLLTSYHGIGITIEPNPDNNPNPSNEIAFFATLPAGGFSHVRHLLSSFGSTPNQTPFIYGLKRNTDLLNDLGQNMLSSFDTGDEGNVRLQAEQMLNLIVGDQSENHKDWNGDGDINDPSDGFGLLLNGTNSGYIQGTIAHANLSVSSSDATENMLTHGKHVAIAVDNLSVWTPQLRDQLIAVLEVTSLTDAEVPVRQAVVLANQIHNGVNINNNENIEAIYGEGGAMTAYEHSYYMADIFVYP